MLHHMTRYMPQNIMPPRAPLKRVMKKEDVDSTVCSTSMMVILIYPARSAPLTRMTHRVICALLLYDVRTSHQLTPMRSICVPNVTHAAPINEKCGMKSILPIILMIAMSEFI